VSDPRGGGAADGSAAPLARVRVTAPRADERPPPLATNGTSTGDPSDVYVRSLIRSQLRVALVTAGSFAFLLAATTAALAFVPEVRTATVGGIPIVWIVLGAGVYPVVLLVASLFVRAAERNEKRYRSLAEET
jgi:hypothetical protein